jgi:hypothetical protein
MRYVLYTLGGIVGIGLLLGLGVATSWFGLVTERPMRQYAEDTRRLTFEHSRAHQSGVNSAIADYCMNMRLATDPTQKIALARWIVNEAGTFAGPLTADASACVADARAAL